MLSSLFRLLLIASLVLNGSGLAMASSMTTMPGMDMHADAAQPSTPTAHDMSVASAKPPCHGSDAGIAGTATQHERSAAGDADRGKPAHPAPDCCQSGGCQCACTHAAQVALALLHLPAATGGAHIPRPRASAHAAPALPHLIRPPIG